MQQVEQHRPLPQSIAGQILLSWHLWSLDAPLVAVVWAALLARTGGSSLSLADGTALALGTWLIYIADRLLDGAHIERACGLDGTFTGAGGEASDDNRGLRERHYFYARHRRLFCTLGGAGVTALAALVCFSMPRLLRELYLLLACPVAIYMVAVHSRTIVTAWRAVVRTKAATVFTKGLEVPGSLEDRRPVPSRMTGRGNAEQNAFESRSSVKEAAVAVLFSAATAAPAVCQCAPRTAIPLLITTLLMASLCWLNCVLIEHWEGADHAHSLPGPPRPRFLKTPWELERLPTCLRVPGLLHLGLPLLGMAAAQWLAAGWHPAPLRLFALPFTSAGEALIAWAGAAAGLCLLNRYSHGASARSLRIWADAALLTPIPFLLPRTMPSLVVPLWIGTLLTAAARDGSHLLGAVALHRDRVWHLLATVHVAFHVTGRIMVPMPVQLTALTHAAPLLLR